DGLEPGLGAQSEAAEGNVGPLLRGHRPDRGDVHRPRDHVVAEPGDDVGEQIEAIAPLVGDQDPQARALSRAQAATDPTHSAGTAPSPNGCGPRAVTSRFDV